MENNNAQCQHDIHDRHEGNQLGSNVTDTFDTADEDQGNDDRQSDTDDQVYEINGVCGQHIEIAQCGIDGSGDGIDLCGITGTEHGQHTESSKQIRQKMPLLSSPFLI